MNSITCRPYEKQDIKQIMDLWESHSDFGGITVHQFNQWFNEGPYENTEIIVATTPDNQVVGQMIFAPTRLILNKKVVKGFRIAAPILHNNLKFSEIDSEEHPLFKMYSCGIANAKAKGFSLGYSFPAKGWLRILRSFTERMHWETATYDGFSVSLESPFIGTTDNDNISVSLASAFTEEYDDLWNDAVNMLPVHCGIIRTQEWLRYRLSGHYTLEARDRGNNHLVGYCTIKKSGLLVDLLARTNEQIEIVFKKTIEALNQMNPNRVAAPVTKVIGMHTPLMQRILQRINIEPLDYKFDFGCFLMDHNIDSIDIKPINWYMMPDV